MSDTLVREAEASGFEVTPTKGGHLRFKAPDGEIIIGAATPSDHRSAKNHRARLKRHGLGQTPEAPDERKEAAKASAAKVSASVAILEILQGTPGTPFTRAELQDKVGCSPKQCGNAMQWLKTKYPQIVRGDEGWAWSEVLAQPVEPEPEPEPETRHRRHGLTNEILEHLKSLAGATSTIEDVCKALDATRSSVSTALFNLQKANEDVHKVSRGKYAYRPKEPTPKDRARARLRILERELRDTSSSVARAVLSEERDRLLKVIEAPDVVEQSPVEVHVPSEPVRPISVVPTDLPEGCPSMFEAVTMSRDSLVLKDENGDLWVARPLKIEVVGVAFANIA